MHKKVYSNNRGLTLVEVVVITAVLGLLSMMLLPTLTKSRSVSWQNQDLANLRAISAGMQSYVLDYQDLLPNFTQVSESKFTDVLPSPGNNQAMLAAKQATEIIRRRGNRDRSFGVRSSWIPHVRYSHLVIADYLELALPSEVFVSPSDLVRSKWMNWQQFENDLYAPMQPTPGLAVQNRSFPYSSSYIANLASYDRLASVLDGVVNARLRPSTFFGSFSVPGNSELGGTTLSKVMHPSRKVYYNAIEQFNFKGTRLHYAVNEAQVTMSFFDGSASLRMTGSANLGWDPWLPENDLFRTFYQRYAPWEPPVSGNSTPTVDVIQNRYTTTRDGLLGIDY